MKFNQRGSVGIVLLVLLGLIVTSGGWFVSQYIGSKNKAVRFEANITKRISESESVLSNGTMALMDKVSVKDDYTEQFRENLLTVINGRTQNDANLLFKGVTEQNPELSDSLHRDLSAFIEGMRKDFHLSRSRVQDACSEYRIALGSVVSGFFMGAHGFPTIDLDESCKTISDERTRGTFESGMQAPLL